MFNGFDMSQMPFPFNMFSTNSEDNEECKQSQKQNGNGFPFQMPFGFGGIPYMPFGMPFAFPFGNMNNKAAKQNVAPNTAFFQFGNFNIPEEFIRMLLQMNSTPEGLERLQKFLDQIFDLYSKEKEQE